MFVTSHSNCCGLCKDICANCLHMPQHASSVCKVIKWTMVRQMAITINITLPLLFFSWIIFSTQFSMLSKKIKKIYQLEVWQTSFPHTLSLKRRPWQQSSCLFLEKNEYWMPDSQVLECQVNVAFILYTASQEWWSFTHYIKLMSHLWLQTLDCNVSVFQNGILPLYFFIWH